MPVVANMDKDWWIVEKQTSFMSQVIHILCSFKAAVTGDLGGSKQKKKVILK